MWFKFRECVSNFGFRLKAAKQNISAYVRHLIEKEYCEKRLRESVLAYEQFRRDHPAEREAMEVWKAAPFAAVMELKPS